ncbi:hypothetical protein AURDEDRAFT_124910 [Auricularia subglabra TFB-10046 SS5]|nr:hypothetical protein AURDEDRAFT_124910 [Auricularia subglabra TFB-10046 SS5]
MMELFDRSASRPGIPPPTTERSVPDPSTRECVHRKISLRRTVPAPIGPRAQGERRAAARTRRIILPRNQLRLPTELWCDVWERLPFSACIAVTHTCRAWRLTALARPSIWTRPVLSFRKSISPTLVSLPESDFRCCRIRYQRSEGANAHHAREVFERSGSMPLHIEMVVDVHDTCLLAIHDFSRALFGVSNRTAGITVRCGEPRVPHAVDALLQAIAELPTQRGPLDLDQKHSAVSYPILRRLTICDSKAQPNTDGFASFYMPPLDTPNLEVLELPYWACLPQDGTKYPSLRRLSWAPRSDMRLFIEHATQLYPHLEHLTVDLSASGLPYWYELIGPTMPISLRLVTVKILNVSESHVARALRVFHVPRIREIDMARVAPGAVQRCSAIFRDLGAEVKLSVLRRNGRVCIAGTDCRGRRRRVSSASSRSPRDQWDALTSAISRGDIPWTNVVRLTVSASHWFRFAAALPAAPAVASLTLVLTRTVEVMLEEARCCASPVLRRTKFPCLRTLEVIARDALPLPHKIRAPDLAALVQVLDVPLLLEALRVDHGIFTGSRAALRGLALKVSVCVYPPHDQAFAALSSRLAFKYRFPRSFARPQSGESFQLSPSNRASKQHLFPTEIWCSVWECLPFSSCIAVTHTCRSWRLMAVACPSLWTHPEFYTAVRGSPWKLRRYDFGSGATNIPFADKILQRSAVLPLHISLNVKPSRVSRAEIQSLAGALDRYSDRVVSICVRGADASAVGVLLRDIKRLPALRCLDIGKLVPSPGPASLLPRTIDLPRLDRVKLSPACRWSEIGNVYLNVKHVSIPPGSDVHISITTAAHACPNIQSLSVDIDTCRWPAALTPATDTASLRSLLTGVRAVRVFGLTVPREAWALAVFHHPERQDILVDGVAARSVENCGVIFRDLGPGVSLRVLRRAARVRVEGTDCSGRRRCVSCKESFSATGWRDALLHAICGGSVDWRSVSRLTVSASHWFRFLDALPAAPAALSLTLVIEHGRLFDKKPPWWTPGCTPKKFPVLRRLDVVGRDGIARMKGQEITSFVRTLDLRLPLVKLGVDHRILAESTAALRAVAQRVSVHVYRIT